MDTQATASLGAKIHVGDGEAPTEGFDPIAEVRDWTYGRGAATEEATSHDSDGFREFIATIGEQSDVSFDVNWIGDDATHDRLEEIYASRRAGTFRFYEPDETDGLEMKAIVVNIVRNRPVVGVLRNSITLRPTGAPTVVAGS